MIDTLAFFNELKKNYTQLLRSMTSTTTAFMQVLAVADTLFLYKQNIEVTP